MTVAEAIRDALRCGKPGCPCARPRGKVHCPAHDDPKPSLSLKDADGKALVKCFSGCAQNAVIAALQGRRLWPSAPTNGTRPRQKKATEARYEIKDPSGQVVAIHCRQDKGGAKEMWWELPDGTKSLSGRRVDELPLYGSERLRELADGTRIVIAEGEKAAEALNRRGVLAVGTVTGAASTPGDDALAPLMRLAPVLWPDNDAPGRAHMARVGDALRRLGCDDVRLVNWAGAPEKGDAADFSGPDAELKALLDGAHTLPSYIAGKPSAAISAPDRGETVPTTLVDVESTFRRWLLMPDMGAVRFALALVAGHRLSGDPLWGFLVAPPSGAKTEIIRSLEDVRGVFPLSELTARTFASGLQNDKRDPSLLARLTDDILTLKDFTTVLTVYREERQAILAQLREIYDGRFDKAWGTGKEIHWTGRLGFVAGVTPIIDQYHAVHQVLGERFTLYRMPQPDRRETALKALRERGREAAMRAELREVVTRFFGCLDCKNPPILPTAFEDRLAALANFTARARSGVVRDPRSRELTLAPDPEGPARLVKQLAGLSVGQALICNSPQVREEDFTFIRKVALDCLPQLRLRVIEALQSGGDFLATGEVAEKIGYPTTTARRHLEDLAALGVVEASKGGSGHADKWQLTEETKGLLDVLKTVSAEPKPDTHGVSVPAMLEGGVCSVCGSPEIDGYTPEGEPRCAAHYVKPTDGPLVRYAVEELGLPIIGRRRPHREAHSGFCLACEDGREIAGAAP